MNVIEQRLGAYLDDLNYDAIQAEREREEPKWWGDDPLSDEAIERATDEGFGPDAEAT